MTMNELMPLTLAALGGAGLGTVFYGGLCWTIRCGIRSNKPALWFSGSLFLRTALVLAGFYAISDGDWRRLVACLTGFLFARVAVTRWGSRSSVIESLKSTGAP